MPARREYGSRDICFHCREGRRCSLRRGGYDGAKQSVAQIVNDLVAHGDYRGVHNAGIGAIYPDAANAELVGEVESEVGEHQFAAPVGGEPVMMVHGTLPPVAPQACYAASHRSGEHRCRPRRRSQAEAAV